MGETMDSRSFALWLLIVAACGGTGTEPEPTAAACPSGWNTGSFFDNATETDVAACLAAGENPNARAPDGRTPLHFAATRDNPAIVSALVAAGARTSTQSADGLTPLCSAARNGSSVPVVQALLDGRASVDGGCSLLFEATSRGPNVTPLCIASGWNSPDIVEALLTAGASVGFVCSSPADPGNLFSPVSAMIWAHHRLQVVQMAIQQRQGGEADALAVIALLEAAGAPNGCQTLGDRCLHG